MAPREVKANLLNAALFPVTAVFSPLRGCFLPEEWHLSLPGDGYTQLSAPPSLPWHHIPPPRSSIPAVSILGCKPHPPGLGTCHVLDCRRGWFPLACGRRACRVLLVQMQRQSRRHGVLGGLGP